MLCVVVCLTLLTDNFFSGDAPSFFEHEMVQPLLKTTNLDPDSPLWSILMAPVQMLLPCRVESHKV